MLHICRNIIGLKVALITDGISPYVLGGMQRHSFFVAKYLALNGVYVDLYHTSLGSKHDIESLEVFTEEEKKYITSIVVSFPSMGRMPGHYLKESYEYSRRIYKEFIKRPPVDFIYVKGFAGWKLIQEKAEGKDLPPIGVKFHGLNMYQTLPNLRAKLEAKMLRPPVEYNIKNADYVFSYGGKISDITRKLGVADDKLIEIPTGIDTEWFHPPVYNNDKVSFVFVGRYERLKGVQEINKAVRMLDQNLDFELHFVGPIPSKHKLSDSKVKYHGELRDMERLRSILDRSDCLLCPSYSEGMPNAIIEAMSRGLAIIATDVGAINFLVRKSNGYLLDSPKVELIRKAMHQFISLSPEERHKLKEASYNIAAKELAWDKIGKDLVEKLESIVNDNHP